MIIGIAVCAFFVLTILLGGIGAIWEAIKLVIVGIVLVLAVYFIGRGIISLF